MDQVVENRYDVLKQLDKEMESLAELRDLVARSSTVSGGMVSILDSFEQRLAKLETTILPVYQQTGNLQRRHQRETEGIIRGGRPSESSAGVQGYLDAMKKLSSACQHFQAHNPKSVELSNVNTLFEAGSEALSREFRDELKKYQRPLNPIVTLDLVAMDTEEISEDALSGVELIPAAACEDLALIASWLDEHSHSDKITVYAKMRSQALIQSLQALRDLQRTTSAERGGVRGAGPSNAPTPAGVLSLTPAGGVGASPAPTLRSRTTLAGKLDATPRSRSHKLTNMLERKTNWMLQRARGGRHALLSTGASPTLASSSSPYSPYTAPVYSPAGVTSPLNTNTGVCSEDSLEDSDVLLYLTQVRALVRLGSCEERLLQRIVPLSRRNLTLETLLREPVEQLATQGEIVSSNGLKCVQRGDWNAVMCLLTLLRHLSATLAEYTRLLHGTGPSLHDRFTSISTYMQQTVVQCLELILESVRGDGADRALPKDGTVHEQTSNALMFVQQLQEYCSVLGDVLVQDASLRSVACVQLPSSGRLLSLEESTALLASYIKRLLSNVALSIVQRSEAYSDTTLRDIFRLNNYNYLLTTLLSTGLMTVLELVEPSARQHYNDQIMQHKKLYFQSWNGVLLHLVDQEELSLAVLSTSKLRDKDRQMIKDKFSGFNKEIEDLQKTQRSYSIPDRKLRESIKRDNKEIILPKYQAFYDRYSTVPFSSHHDKYVKYTPAEVSSLIDKFFDVAA